MARLSALLCLTWLLVMVPMPLYGVIQDDVALKGEFEGPVREIVARYCHQCHNEDLAEADINLGRFEELDDVRSDLATWQKVAEMLDSQQMPPKDEKQPSESELRSLRRWLESLLKLEAARMAGDPGPVVLRRLNNAEFNYAVRDLTGVAVLDPTREFPVDSAAGEGFTNASHALSMSPSMFSKYLDAAKEIAAHAVLTPDGFYFSPHTTRRDWTEELLTQIRNLYARYTANEGGTQVNLQGIVFDTNGGGRLPIEQYLLATLEERARLTNDAVTFEEVATARGLSPKYLRLLWQALHDSRPSLLLDGLRERWKSAQPQDVTSLTAYVVQWQKSLWRFSSVGHIGKVNGPRAWLEPTDPVVEQNEIRVSLQDNAPEKVVSLYLVTSDAGDGNAADFAVWERPRLVAPGRPDLLLRDVRRAANHLAERRSQIFRDAEACLMAATEVTLQNSNLSLKELADKSSVDESSLQAWFEYLSVGSHGKVTIDSLLTQQSATMAGYEFVKGWIGQDALSLVANASNQAVRIPGVMKPHSVAVHPAPGRRIAVGWMSPVAGRLRMMGSVQHAHPECGNGVTWSIELRRGNSRQRLASGIAQGARGVPFGPLDEVFVQPGDLVSLIIGPRDGNHSCDLTAIEWNLHSGSQSWDLAKELSPDVLAGNPHADSYGNGQVWHIYSEPTLVNNEHVIPSGSLLARWQATGDADLRKSLAKELQSFLADDADRTTANSADREMFAQLRSLTGPLLSQTLKSIDALSTAPLPSDENRIGLDEGLFGKHPDGSEIDEASLCVQAPSVIEVQLPADLTIGAELVVTGRLHPRSSAEGSVQMEVRKDKPSELAGLSSITISEQIKSGVWTSNNRNLKVQAPIVVAGGSPARARYLENFEHFRQLFPAALCYSKIVPVDEVVTLTLYYREDDHLRRLMLNDAETAELERLWERMHFVSQDALLSVDAYEQLWQYATQDADPSAFEPLREPLQRRAADYRQLLIASEPSHLAAVLQLADAAYRRPLRETEKQHFSNLYDQLRAGGLPHDAAIRMLLARIFVSPAFLYRTEVGRENTYQPKPIATRAIDGYELATRLSFFLWSSVPDATLRSLASAGKLHQPDVLRSERERMLNDPRARRLATEFVCQWLHIYDFDRHDEKSESLFPEFAGLRGPMYEEAIRCFTDLFVRDGSILELLEADHTFVNAALAKHYGMEGFADQPSDQQGWSRVKGIGKAGRGGILGLAATLAKQSGAARTSPILRGNWISEVLIGEKLPKPPKDVPQLPESLPSGLTERQLIEQHSSNAACAKCHARIDPLGFALENFDAIGRWRDGPQTDSRTQLTDGRTIDGVAGLRGYLLEVRRQDFVRQFCKKCLGYALGRAVQLSDEPLLDEMQAKLEANDYRVSLVIDAILNSPQFQRIRAEQ